MFMCCLYINLIQKMIYYHPVLDCRYWPVLGYFNNRNIKKFTNRSISSEDFDKINNIFLDITSENTDYLAQTGKHGEINTNHTKTMGHYAIKYVSTKFKLQESTTIYGQVSKYWDLDVRAPYLWEIGSKKIWYSE